MTTTTADAKPMHFMPHETTLERPKASMAVSHTVRTRDGGKKALRYGRKQAIKLFCTECLGWESDPRECTAPLCPLFPFRGRTLKSQKGDAQ